MQVLRIIALLVLWGLCMGAQVSADEIRLDGLHAVSLESDDPAFADPEYDDSGWKRMHLPSSLRAAGLEPRTDVYWLRLSFDLPATWDMPAPALRLGVITRADETYLNGVRVGGLGQIGSRLSDWHAYAPTMPRLYPVDPALLRPGARNVIAIRGAREPYVDDGGVISGPISVVSLPSALADFQSLSQRFTSLRYTLLGVETMILFGMILALALRIQSRFLGLFALFYTPAYIFSFERRGALELLGADGPSIQFLASLAGALTLPGLIAFMAHVLHRPIGFTGRSLQVLSIACLFVFPNTSVSLLQWWAIEVHLVWHILMLLALLLMFVFAALATHQGSEYASALLFGFGVLLLCIFADISTPMNALERNYGVRIGELGIITLYLSMAYVVVLNISHRETELRRANANITRMHEEERDRMARDVHDGIGQWLSTIKIKIDVLTSGNFHDTNDVLKGVRNDIDATIQDVRRISHDLAPVLLVERGLVGAMTAHAQGLAADGSHQIDLNLPERVRLSSATTPHVFRIYQEALANALRHSNCHQIDISIVQTRKDFSLTISDDGIGFSTNRNEPGLGIQSMKARAKILDGDLDLHSIPGNGTTVAFAMTDRAAQRATL